MIRTFRRRIIIKRHKSTTTTNNSNNNRHSATNTLIHRLIKINHENEREENRVPMNIKNYKII